MANRKVQRLLGISARPRGGGHCIVSGGGLTADHKIRGTGNKFFIPVAVLRDKFKGKFLSRLNALYTESG